MLFFLYCCLVARYPQVKRPMTIPKSMYREIHRSKTEVLLEQILVPEANLLGPQPMLAEKCRVLQVGNKAVQPENQVGY